MRTAQRAGLRRSLARLRRLLALRWLNPRLASRLYPLRVVTPSGANSCVPVPVSVRDLRAWNGSISLLNSLPFSVDPPVDWDANPLGHALWPHELHGFEWAWPLVNRAATGDARAADALVGLLGGYASRVPFGRGAAWEPYPLSRRLVVWSAASSVLEQSGHSEAAKAVAAQVDQGARFLSANVERDLDNNHVIANARALAYAGTLLRSGASLPSYARTGFKLLWSQLRAQVRRDGGHVEGSTSYHFQVWRDGVETACLARENGLPVPADIVPLLAGMRDWLLALRRPDGGFPLLGDSVIDSFSSFDVVSAATDSLVLAAGLAPPVQAHPHGSFVLRDSGYAVLQEGGTRVLFDAGPFGAFHCPGHGHADALSFELFAEGQLLIADPGVYQYEAGKWRDYFRGTRAHSTLLIDGHDQSELSSSFRVGRMARARITAEQLDRSPLFVRGELAGYTAPGSPLVHSRSLALPNSHMLVIQDQVEGNGEHDFELRFHLAPGARASLERDAVLAHFQDVALRFQFVAPSSAQANVEDGWYSPSWYRRQPVPVVALRWRGLAPCIVGTTVTISTGE